MTPQDKEDLLVFAISSVAFISISILIVSMLR